MGYVSKGIYVVQEDVKEEKALITIKSKLVNDNDEDKNPYNYITDVLGYNKYYGWYQGKAEDFAGWFDKFHKTNPNVKVGISEYGAEVILQYCTNDPKVKDLWIEWRMK